MLGALTGIKLAVAGALLAAVLGLGWTAKHEYDAAAAARAQVAAQALQLATYQADAKANDTALSAAQAAIAARNARSSNTRNLIHAAPATATCASSPAISAALGGLRSPAAATGTPARAEHAAHVH